MKPIQKGMLIGVAIAVVPVLLMGATNYEVQKASRYELHVTGDESRSYVLDTVTGETVYLKEGKRYTMKSQNY